MAGLMDSKVDEVMLKTRLAANDNEEKDRQEKSNKRLAIYHDDWADILNTYLRTQFIEANLENVRWSLNVTQNLTKKIINEISLVYKDPANRSTDPESDTYNDILEYLNLDHFMKKTNKYTNLLNDMMIKVEWNEEKAQIELKLITPSITSVIQDPKDPSKANAIMYRYELADTAFSDGSINVVWTKDEHFYLTDEGNRITVDGNEDMLNPYKDSNKNGIIPIVVIHRDQIPGLFWNTTEGNDFISGTVSMGMKKTFKDYLYKTQSFRQPYITVGQGDTLPTAPMISDPLTVLAVKGDNAQIGTLDLKPDFNSIDKTLKEDANDFLSTYGLTMESFAGVEASGKALEVKNRQLQEVREDQIETFRAAEKDLFEIIKAVNNYHSDSKIPENAVLKIDFAETDLSINAESQRASADHDVKAGLISPGQYYQIFNPDIKDEKEAEKALIKNLKKTSAIKDAGFSINDSVEGDNA